MTMPVSDATTEAILAMTKEANEKSDRISALEMECRDLRFRNKQLESRLPSIEAKWVATPIPMLLHCPACHERHIDEGEFATREHHSHACQSCGHVWRPAIVATVGVRFLPGFKNDEWRGVIGLDASERAYAAAHHLEKWTAKEIRAAHLRHRPDQCGVCAFDAFRASTISSSAPGHIAGHDPMWRTYKQGLVLVGCSCGFQCKTDNPDDDLAAHVALIRAVGEPSIRSPNP
jgi:hypothetical protein